MMMQAITGAGLVSFTSFAAFAPQLAVAPPAFEVASIRPSAPGGRGVSLQIAPGGRFTAENASLRSLIKMAYGVRDFQISGGPGWLDSDKFNINSKAEGNPSEDQVRLMVQTLLSNRFKLDGPPRNAGIHGVYAGRGKAWYLDYAHSLPLRRA
jgi:Protein of unknown function (DUF3738)